MYESRFARLRFLLRPRRIRKWADDLHWLPLLLEGKRFEGEFTFRDQETMVSFDMREI
jgi:hypothetical protein